jgi:hypothetical protein
MPFELGGAVGVALFFLWLYCIFDAITAEATLVRNLPKMFWIFLVIILFDVGSIMWLIAGRPRAEGRPGGMPYKGNSGGPERSARRSRSGPVAPDDDPQFLASLDRTHLSAWEQDLKRREDDLRRRDDLDRRENKPDDER